MTLPGQTEALGSAWRSKRAAIVASGFTDLSWAAKLAEKCAVEIFNNPPKPVDVPDFIALQRRNLDWFARNVLFPFEPSASALRNLGGVSPPEGDIPILTFAMTPIAPTIELLEKVIKQAVEKAKKRVEEAKANAAPALKQAKTVLEEATRNARPSAVMKELMTCDDDDRTGRDLSYVVRDVVRVTDLGGDACALLKAFFKSPGAGTRKLAGAVQLVTAVTFHKAAGREAALAVASRLPSMDCDTLYASFKAALLGSTTALVTAAVGKAANVMKGLRAELGNAIEATEVVAPSAVKTAVPSLPLVRFRPPGGVPLAVLLAWTIPSGLEPRDLEGIMRQALAAADDGGAVLIMGGAPAVARLMDALGGRSSPWDTIAKGSGQGAVSWVALAIKTKGVKTGQTLQLVSDSSGVDESVSFSKKGSSPVIFAAGRKGATALAGLLLTGTQAGENVFVFGISAPPDQGAPVTTIHATLGHGSQHKFEVSAYGAIPGQEAA